MQVEFRLTPEDLTALKRFHRLHPPIPPQQRPQLTRLLSWGIALAVVCSLMFLYGIVHDPVFDNLFGTFPGVAVGLILGLVVLQFVTKLASRNASQKLLELGRNAEKVLGWRCISIEPQAIHVETEYSNLVYQWWAIDAVAASPDHAFIYFLTNSAFIVPREAFRTDRAFDEFVELARRYHRMAEVSAEPRGAMGTSGPSPGRRTAGVEPPPLPREAETDKRITPPGRLSEKRDSNP